MLKTKPRPERDIAGPTTQRSAVRVLEVVDKSAHYTAIRRIDIPFVLGGKK